MNFRFTPKRGRRRPGYEEATFTIGRLWADDAEGMIEVTHLLDRKYGYRSARELRWHLAERFELPQESVQLDRI